MVIVDFCLHLVSILVLIAHMCWTVSVVHFLHRCGDVKQGGPKIVQIKKNNFPSEPYS